uniref:Uncharacterized protein n=1 Tax=Cyanoderma ruficeps TaxID=181631 RepID=A0A8C3NMN6_9PASS
EKMLVWASPLLPWTEDAVAGEARLLRGQEAPLRDGPDGDHIRVHVDAPVLPDERQPAGIRADVHPVLLLLRHHLWSGRGEMCCRGQGMDPIPPRG